MGEYKSVSNPYKRKKNGKPSSIGAHRMVWIKAHGKIPDGYCIHHKNGLKCDNRLENLECLSRKEHRLKHIRST